MTVRRLRREMPEAEFVEWIAFFEERSRRHDAATPKPSGHGRRSTADTPIWTSKRGR